jgi:Flp pilus assembly protein TadD
VSKPSRSAPAAAESHVKTRYIEAVTTYERGLEALRCREFQSAVTKFREVLDRFPEEPELHDRALVYLKVCDRELQPKSGVPRSLEERVYASTVALNAGRDDEAFVILTRADAEGPDSGHVQYMLAMVHARRGARDEALAHLQRAVALDPENRFLARRDTDFEDLAEDEEFLRITEPPAASGRRRARARTTR